MVPGGFLAEGAPTCEDVPTFGDTVITAKDIAFHTFLCRMSKNPVFERMLPVIIKSVRASYSLLVPRLSNGPRVSIHGEIYKAVAAHDGDEAYRLMVAHLSNSRQGFDQKVKKERNAKGGKTELPQKQ